MSDVVVEGLSKNYRGGIHALRDCHFRAPDGKFTVIVGPSGCGKTTLLRLIAGLEQPGSGVIRIGDAEVNSLQPRQRDVAMVFQDFALYPHMRVRKNLEFAASLRKLEPRELQRRVEHAASLLRIEHLLNRKPSELSGGERQRAALGRVLVRQPACALYDEPLSNLDTALRVQLRAELKMVQKQAPTTSIFVTHDQEEAMNLADQLIVMAQGEIQQAGSPLEVYRKPCNRFVAGFLGNPSMNFFNGHITVEHERVFLQMPGDVKIALDTPRAAMAGRDVVLGIRPEKISIAAHEAGIAARVIAIEHYGSHCTARCEFPGGNSLLAIVSDEVQIGDTLKLHVRLEDFHLFQPGEFGQAL